MERGGKSQRKELFATWRWTWLDTDMIVRHRGGKLVWGRCLICGCRNFRPILGVIVLLSTLVASLHKA